MRLSLWLRGGENDCTIIIDKGLLYIKCSWFLCFIFAYNLINGLWEVSSLLNSLGSLEKSSGNLIITMNAPPSRWSCDRVFFLVKFWWWWWTLWRPRIATFFCSAPFLRGLPYSSCLWKGFFLFFRDIYRSNFINITPLSWVFDFSWLFLKQSIRKELLVILF